MPNNQQSLPYGLWPSPITPAMIGAGIRLNDVQWARGSDTLVWSQSFSSKTSLMARSGAEAAVDLSGEFNPAGGVLYGGGDFFAGRSGAVFAERNGRLYYVSYTHGQPRAITPTFGAGAAPVLSDDEKTVIYVHSYEGRDVLAAARLDGQTWPVILASGADFYAHPALSPDGRRVAWIEWDHPNMPWDGTRLFTAQLDQETLRISEITRIDGGAAIPCSQPTFSPDGSKLAYLVNNGEWDDLVVLSLATGEKQTLIHQESMLQPIWVQGQHTFAWAQDSASLYVILNHLGSLSLVKASAEGQNTVDLAPFTFLDQVSVSESGALALIASASACAPRILKVEQGKLTTTARAQSDSVDPAYFSTPQPFSWRSSDGATVHGLFSPPANPRATAEGLPPVVVYIHGGPTSQVYNAFDLDRTFFTSRGYGYFAINYRGSAGYGRSYRDALRGNWGSLDVQDAFEGTQALVDAGLADPNKLVIKGSSAGGYTLLNALIRHPGFFKAGICSYGVTNLFLMEMDTHKFEAHYNASLVGQLPEAAQKFHDWSPIFHANRIQDPLAIFQGEDDRVVSPEQAESLVNILRANHVPHVYRLYAREGHGFRKAETLADFYETTDRFLKQYVIFSV